eukprot:8527338-Prorocentrum_lima.AAC.1
MTSSLVGSEMCIRDRFGPADGLTPNQLGFYSTHLGTCSILEEDEARKACLLYTSDAADDM